MRKLAALCEIYRAEFGSYPAGSANSSTGAEFRSLLMHSPTYSKGDPLQSYWGGAYSCVVVNPGSPAVSCLIIDPGPDKLLGGTLDPQKGFVPDASDANLDGKPDDQDNIRSDQLDK